MTLLTPLASPTHAQDSVREVFDRVNSSVVIIHTSSSSYPMLTTERPVAVGGTGSGVLISPTEVLTAAHVVQTANDIVVEFPDGRVYDARVSASRPSFDVAMLELAAPSDVAPATLGDSDQLEIGDRVMVVGAPLGQGHTLTVGYLSARRKQQGLYFGGAEVEFLQTDAAINPGNSGGPMFNMQGEVVGIVSHILTLSGGSMGLGYTVAANDAERVLRGGSSFWSGLELTPLTGGLSALLNVPDRAGGLLVKAVSSDSPAAALGLRPSTIPIDLLGEEVMIGGDIILSVEGIPVGRELENLEIILEVVSGLPSGDLIHVSILRGGMVIDLSAMKP